MSEVKICLFSGTTEGRELAFSLADCGAKLTVCTATEYGGTLSSAPGARILTGGMDCAQMQELFRKEKFDLVADATHPHARTVTKNIRTAAEREGIPYFRIVRDVRLQEEGVVLCDSPESAAKYLKDQQGSVFLATGSRSLDSFATLQKRLVVRVLPLSSSLAACERIGLTPAQIIAMQGPFSEQDNEYLFSRYPCEWLVTKQTGERGGTDAKICAAKARGMGIVVIAAPEEAGYSPAAFLQAAAEKFGWKRSGCDEI